MKEESMGEEIAMFDYPNEQVLSNKLIKTNKHCPVNWSFHGNSSHIDAHKVYVPKHQSSILNNLAIIKLQELYRLEACYGQQEKVYYYGSGHQSHPPYVTYVALWLR